MNSKKVLVIEDNDLNLKLVKSLLQHANYEVMAAANAEKGIHLARDHHPDLILMDIQLPGMDGFTATKLISAHPDLMSIPIVALTSNAIKGDVKKASDAGCVACIPKPIDAESFLQTIAELLC